MKKLLLSLLALGSIFAVDAQSYKFDLTGAKTPKAGYTAISSQDLYSKEKGYGYDKTEYTGTNPDKPFFFSVDVPDGNYKVKVTLGNDKDASSNTVRAESRRMMAQNVETKKGEEKEVTFTVNKRDVNIKGKDKVKIKDREKESMRWDDKLTLEFTGENPHVKYIEIEPVEKVTTIFVCGDSTVTDNDAEPYSGWAQFLPLMFDENVSVSNYAESGLSANTFLGQKRLDKAMTQMKKGDYVLIEFGHNDQKQQTPGAGAYYNYAYSLKQYIDYAKQKGAIPILITPTRRRQYDKDGSLKDTHGDYPAAMKEVAQREGVILIDFQELTKPLIESLGQEGSKKLFVHYPEGTYPGQDKELKDNTHFSNFGAYEISRIFVTELANQNIAPLAEHVRPEYGNFNPANPDKPASFKYQESPLVSVGKPAGN